MRELATQEYIRQHGLESFCQTFHITTTSHPTYNNLVHLKYDMFECDFSKLEVRECRALILDRDQDWEIVSYPYDKFANYGESYADSIDWLSARVYEKVDGSLICMYFYDNKFHVSTSGTPDGRDFAPLFWEQFERQGMVLPLTEEGTMGTWMFEYVSPETRVVVPYMEPHIYFHGCRNMLTLEEGRPEWFHKTYNWDLVKSFPLTTIQEVIDAAKVLSPGVQEGFVVVDKDYHRLKIKSPLYVAMHHMMGHITTRALLDIARKAEHLEFLAYFPQLETQVEEFRRQFNKLEMDIYQTFYRIRHDFKDRKDFAHEAIQYPYSYILFGLLDGKINLLKEHLVNIPIEKLERIMGLHE